MSTSTTTSTSTSTETSTSSSTGADETAPATDAATFILLPDGGPGPVCPETSQHARYECDPFSDDCAPGYKCSPHWFEQDGEAVALGYPCVPVVDDPQAVGEPCTIAGDTGSPCDDCDGESRCWPAREGPVCTAICEGSRTDLQCPDGTACAMMWDANFLLCVPTCDPLVPECGDGFGCVATSRDEFVCFPALVGETALVDEPCVAEGEKPCADGLACVHAELVGAACDGRDGCCRPMCDLDAPLCGDGETCVAYLEDPVARAHADVGWCAG